MWHDVHKIQQPHSTPDYPLWKQTVPVQNLLKRIQQEWQFKGSYVYTLPAQTLQMQDMFPRICAVQQIQVPRANAHGNVAWGMGYVQCEHKWWHNTGIHVSWKYLWAIEKGWNLWGETGTCSWGHVWLSWDMTAFFTILESYRFCEKVPKWRSHLLGKNWNKVQDDSGWHPRVM